MTGTARGFTLIELLVSVALFSLLLLIILGIFSRFVFVQRRDIGEQALQEDLRFALEMFNREVRTGFGTTYRSNGNAVTFRNQNGACVEYRLQDQNWVRAAHSEFDSTVECDTVAYSGHERLLGATTEVQELHFTVQPAEFDEATTRLTRQGFITVSLIVQAAQKTDRPIALQSTVASRQVTAYGVTPVLAGKNAACVDFGAPDSVPAGASFDVSITMRNTGSATWLPVEGPPYRLGSQNPQDNLRWGIGRFELPASVTEVPPEATVTFTATLTAPTTPGVYPLSWRMLQETVEWFGETCGKQVTVG